jgi:hypothetical protein
VGDDELAGFREVADRVHGRLQQQRVALLQLDLADAHRRLGPDDEGLVAVREGEDVREAFIFAWHDTAQVDGETRPLDSTLLELPEEGGAGPRWRSAQDARGGREPLQRRRGREPHPPTLGDQLPTRRAHRARPAARGRRSRRRQRGCPDAGLVGRTGGRCPTAAVAVADPKRV